MTNQVKEEVYFMADLHKIIIRNVICHVAFGYLNVRQVNAGLSLHLLALHAGDGHLKVFF